MLKLRGSKVTGTRHPIAALGNIISSRGTKTSSQSLNLNVGFVLHIAYAGDRSGASKAA